MSTEGHAESMQAPILRQRCTGGSCKQGRYPCATPEACYTPVDEAEDRPVTTPWDGWFAIEIVAGVVVLAFLAILARFFYVNRWLVVAAFS